MTPQRINTATPLPKEHALLSLMPHLGEKKTQTFTILVLTLITLAFFGFFAISPTVNTIVDLRKQISDQTFVSQKLDQKIANLSVLEQKYSQIKNDVPFVLSAIPQDPQITLLLGQIQSIAAQNTVTMSQMQTFPLDIVGNLTVPYTSYVFTIDASGSYDNLKQFITNLINFNRIVTIDNFGIDQGENNAFRLSLRGRVYFKK